MEKISTVSDLIALWPRRADLASDITQALGGRSTVSVDVVHKWARSGSIPARFHFALLSAARDRGFEVTAELIVRVHGDVGTTGQEDAA